MNKVEVVKVVEAPIERVFARYTDHEGWAEWTGLGRVVLTREGTPVRQGVGCVRGFKSAPGLREEVVLYEPPTRMDYRIVAGGGPLVDHHGEVHFAEVAGGTRVTWTVVFRSRIPGFGKIMELALTALFRRVLNALARDLTEKRAA